MLITILSVDKVLLKRHWYVYQYVHAYDIQTESVFALQMAEYNIGLREDASQMI